LLDQFRDPIDLFKILIVTAHLLIGFDAPILQDMDLGTNSKTALGDVDRNGMRADGLNHLLLLLMS